MSSSTNLRTTKRKRNSSLNNLVQKPVLEVGDEVYSAWWGYDGDEEPAWWPGIITSVTIKTDEDFGYGPTRIYDIEFDDGDALSDVSDMWVFEKLEYELITRRRQDKNQGSWEGIKHVIDEESQDEWAKYVGWYTVSVNGDAEKSFNSLRDALKASKRSSTSKTPKKHDSRMSVEDSDASGCGNGDNGSANRVCNHCQKQFKSLSGYGYHVGLSFVTPKSCRTENNGQQTMVCDFCFKVFKSEAGFRYHIDKAVCRNNFSSFLTVGGDDEAGINEDAKSVEEPDEVKTTVDNDSRIMHDGKLSDNAESGKLAASSKKEDSNEEPTIIRLTPDQMKALKLKFPVGCSVWTNLRFSASVSLVSFQRGIVEGAYVDCSSCKISYEVTCGGCTDYLSDKEIVYPVGSSVYYSSSEQFDSEHATLGQVLRCQMEKDESGFIYAVETCICTETERYHVAEGIPAAHVKYNGTLASP